jgi:hypothetical protein
MKAYRAPTPEPCMLYQNARHDWAAVVWMGRETRVALLLVLLEVEFTKM